MSYPTHVFVFFFLVSRSLPRFPRFVYFPPFLFPFLCLAIILPYPSHASFSPLTGPHSSPKPVQSSHLLSVPCAPTRVPLPRKFSFAGSAAEFYTAFPRLARAPVLCRFPPRFLSHFSSQRLTLTILSCVLPILFLRNPFFPSSPPFPSARLVRSSACTGPRERRL